ncbi:hypothetical protein [Thiocapsa sp. UBA6158]|uniref:hypothetical protein n=1 Tax=Thiocapsa sp. UBA6158 TaxID=1947692 RepID=UPI0025E297B6|nr:hypothetical protein [Thiocapsa sp. UBA6158]
MSTHAAPPPNGASLYAHPVAQAILNEALALLGDGVPATTVEAASLAASLRSGVLAVLDDISLETLDHALHAELHALEHAHDHGHSRDHGHDHDHGHPHHDHGPVHHDHHAHGHEHNHAPAPANPKPHAHKVKSRRMPEPAVYVLEKMAHGYRRMGRSGGAGFYDHGSEPPQLWSGLKTFERRTAKVLEADVVDRLRYAAMLGALRATGDAPTAALETAFGTQVPLTAEAAVSTVQSLGTEHFLARCRELAMRYGERFEPAGPTLAALGIAGH